MIDQKQQNQDRWALPLIILIIVLTAIWLANATKGICPWPTDTYYFYLPTASKLFDLPFLSDMHVILPPDSLGRVAMHGKEALVLGIALMQKFLNDTSTIYPNILLLIAAAAGSSLCIYLIVRKLFGPRLGLGAFLLFSGSFWPYLYVLQGSHQPLVLMFFLLTFLLLLYAHQNICFLFLGGLSLGFMFFSSPTAVLYIPYFAFLFLSEKFQLKPEVLLSKKTLANILLFVFGVGIVFLLFTLPDPIKSLQQFLHFVSVSRSRNHFDHYRNEISQMLPSPYNLSLPSPLSFRGGGWPWVFKYFTLIMPILFPLYLGCLTYILIAGKQRRILFILLLASLSTPILVEVSQVAQFGRNYFSWFFGMIMLIVLTADHLTRSDLWQKSFLRIFTVVCAILIIIAHISWNILLFTQDILPSRMGTARLNAWLQQKDIREIYIHIKNPNNDFFPTTLDYPQGNDRLTVKIIGSLTDIDSGTVLIAPMTGNHILHDCVGPDFDHDPRLNEIARENLWGEYGAIRFRTLASSVIWTQEEEVCAYRNLIAEPLDPGQRMARGSIYLLDVRRAKSDQWEGIE